MIVTFTGSRDFTDEVALLMALRGVAKAGATVHVGDARGLDAMAKTACDRIGIPVVVFPADWRTEGKAAGFRRNARMIASRPDRVVAFYGPSGETPGTRHTVPLTPLGVEALRAQRAMQDADLGPTPRPIDGLVFTSERGNPLHETNTLKALQADLAAAGLPRVTQHDLRHSCATLLYSMGVPLETIADILGHATPRITAELYRHRVPELARAAADRMQEALG